MAFNTMTFILFFVFVLLGYYIVPKKFKWMFLLLMSYFFYLYASIKFAFFILFTTISSYFAAIWLSELHTKEKVVLNNSIKENKKQIKADFKKRRKMILIVVLILNFGVLFLLKYFNFFSENVNQLLTSLSLTGKLPAFNLILPLGISFYTFQTMSYVIDVYWGKIKAEKNFGKVALFVSFFPQILEGPIGRFNDLAPQLYEGRKIEYEHLRAGVQLMLWGYFKKMVIADRVAIIADYVFEHYMQISGLGVIFGVFMYAIQDYTDFSGCIDIARGCARAMGINMAENFKRPYFSKTIPEFWRRWHITLGAWMKDYIFYPFSLTKGMRKLGKFAKAHLGKSIGNTLPIAIGNVLVFFLVGVWHGANWNYIIWGLFYGFLIAISGLLKPVFNWLNMKLRINTKNRLFQGFQIVRTFYITCLGCVIFRATSLSEAWAVFQKTWNIFDAPVDFKSEFLSFGLNKNNYIILLISLAVLFIIDVLQERRTAVKWWNRRGYFMIRYILYVLLFTAIILFGIYGAGYNQSQFVYMQF